MNPDTGKDACTSGLTPLPHRSSNSTRTRRLPLRSNRWPLRARRTPGLAEGATNRYNSDARRIAAYIAWSLENTGYKEPVHAPGLYFEGRLPSISHRLGVGMSADAANTSVCATASNAGCRISSWRTHSCVPRPHSCGRLCLKCDEKSRLRFSGRPTCSLSRISSTAA